MDLLNKYQEAISSLPCSASLDSFTINGLRFYGVISGSKGDPLVVLLHGFPECWYSWRRQIAVLSNAGYRVIAPDLRGYGLNDKPKEIKEYHTSLLTGDVQQLIIQQGGGPAIVVGHDWGGAIAWNLAMNSPSLVSRLVILNAPHPVTFSRELKDRSSEQYRMSWYIRFFQKLSWPEKVLTHSPDDTAEWFFRKRWASHPQAFTDRDLSVYSSAYKVPGAMSAMLNWYRASFRYRSGPKPVIAPIAAETLIIWGEEDQVLSPKLLDELGEWVPHQRVERIPTAGHFVQNEAPEEVNRLLLEFLHG